MTSQDLSNISTTHLSRSLSSTAEGHLLSLANVSETSSHTSHVFQADFFDLPWKDDTRSQPLKAWKKRIHVFSLVLWLKPTHVLGSILSSLLTHMFSRPSCIKEGITEDMMTMSVWLAWIIRDLCPCFTACWENMCLPLHDYMG